MMRQKNLIKRCLQDNKDAGSDWARRAIALSCRCVYLDEFLLADGFVPVCFDLKKLTPIHQDGIV